MTLGRRRTAKAFERRGEKMEEKEEREIGMRDGAGERGNRAERNGRKCPLPPFPPC